MKKILYILLLICFVGISCKTTDDEPVATGTSDPTGETSFDPLISKVGSYAYGGDISWLSEMEHDGKRFYHAEGPEDDCLQILKDLGMNTVRLRVWVDPYGGWSGKTDVVNMALRARKTGMRILIDFHYSDFFCDPSRQVLPYAWKDYTFEQVKTAIAEHTIDVLTALKSAGIEPEWVQVGNEITPGMVFPHGQLWDDNGDLPNGYKNLATLTNSGYDAVKQILPDAKVILHCHSAFENKNWWYRRMKAAGAKFDIIGLSHYPMDNTTKTFSDMNKDAVSNIKLLIGEFNVPVMLVEFGTKANNQNEALDCVEDFKARTKEFTLNQLAGVIYWEPQVYGGWKPAVYKSTDTEWNKYHVGGTKINWNAYDMGAFTTTGKPNLGLIELYKHE